MNAIFAFLAFATIAIAQATEPGLLPVPHYGPQNKAEQELHKRYAAQFKDHTGPAELELAKMLIRELPERQRSILLAARLDGLPRREIAQRLGISLSLVEKELKQAHEYCMARWARLGKTEIDGL